MTRNFLKICVVAVTAMLAASCSNSNEWTVEGTIQGCEGDLLTLEASNNGLWYQLDTVTLNEKGNFKFSSEAAGYPDIYRLRIGKEAVYFPVDSIETVKIETAVPFGSAYTLEGSDDALSFVRVNTMIDQMVRAKGITGAVNDENLKKSLSQEIIANPASMTAYYIINKKIGDYPLFNPAVKSDIRIIGAVANAFDIYRPTDPRTKYLKSLYLANRQRNPSAIVSDTIAANISDLIEIELYDETGKKISLRDVASQGKVTVLNFTALTAEQSPAYNIELAKTYDAFKDQGIEIYQVAVDPDEYAWRNSAKNLPWITVYASPTTDAMPLANYNVRNIPALFIINRKGELSERVENITDLTAAVRKYM